MRRAAGSVWCKLLVWLLVVILTMTCAIYTFLELLCWDIAGPSREETPAETVELWLGNMMHVDMEQVLTGYWPAFQEWQAHEETPQAEYYGRILQKWQMDFAPEAKNFRFSLQDEDGNVLLSNKPEAEEEYLIWDVQRYTEVDESYTLYGYVTIREDIYDVYTVTQIALQDLLWHQDNYVPFAVVSGVLAFIGLLWLLFAAGHRKDSDEIKLRAVDRIPWDVALCLHGTLAICVVFGIAGLLNTSLSREFILSYGGKYMMNIARYKDMALWAASLAGSCAGAGTLILMSWSARMKISGWWKNSVIYRICAWFGRGCKKAGTVVVDKVIVREKADDAEKKLNFIVRGWRAFWGGVKRFFRWIGRGIRAVIGKSGETVDSLPLIWKGVVVALALFCLELIALAQAMLWSNGFWSVTLNVIVCLVIIRLCVVMKDLQTAAKNIADGDLNYRVDTSKMRFDFKAHGEDLNRIGDGLSLSVDDRLKSERMKTELITNVSHDLKTPLTSIVNYVDLLKKEGLTGTAGEYVEVLDRQSARLKKLTEDLVEASKASTGNLHVTLETVNVSEFLEQAQAEYAARLVTAGLTAVMQVPEEALPARSDGRYLWRIMDNLLGNACKYALPGTRVYISAERREDMVVISVKNISREKLNISADELMERFVRGDSSRNTEGSGLGLSIAQSLAALMGGRLELTVDGDLFKAEVFLPGAEG